MCLKQITFFSKSKKVFLDDAVQQNKTGQKQTATHDKGRFVLKQCRLKLICPTLYGLNSSSLILY